MNNVFENNLLFILNSLISQAFLLLFLVELVVEKLLNFTIFHGCFIQLIAEVEKLLVREGCLIKGKFDFNIIPTVSE
jgi:hypothetical protein